MKIYLNFWCKVYLNLFLVIYIIILFIYKNTNVWKWKLKLFCGVVGFGQYNTVHRRGEEGSSVETRPPETADLLKPQVPSGD